MIQNKKKMFRLSNTARKIFWVARIYDATLPNFTNGRAIAPPAPLSPTPMQYIDDTSAMILKKHLEQFFDHLNLVESAIKFNLEIEENERISFFDVIVIRQLDCLIKTDFYKKPIHSDRYLNFYSCQSISQKRSVIKTLMKRLSLIASDEKSREQEQQSPIFFRKKWLYQLANQSKHFRNGICSI